MPKDCNPRRRKSGESEAQYRKRCGPRPLGQIKMGEKIAQASLIISTLRDAGYKNTSYAVAELVDNSIEAEAKNINICIESGEQLVNQTTSERIQKIAVFDDGVGMEKDSAR